MDRSSPSSSREQATNLLWRIQLFGGPILHSASGTQQTRFRSKKVAALLSYLALHHEQACSREALIEALWPEDTDKDALPNRFRVTLASLRRQLEPPGFPFGSVLDNSVAGCIALRKGSTTCDVTEFEAEYARGNLHRAADLLHAPLLPGVYDEWASEFQIRFHLLEEELAPSRSASPERPDEPASTWSSPRRNARLPSFLTEYVPSPDTLSQVTELLGAHRFLTITGAAGIGKTRLSIEATRLSKHNAVFVPLADCTALHEFFDAVLKALGAGIESPDSLEDQLLDTLQSIEPTIIILDNIDHLVEQSSDFLSDALTANPHISCIATSRRALEIPGEAVYRLETLPNPVSVPASSSELLDYPATALFLKRLKQSRPDFRVREADIPLIVEICTRLQGLPLAIELAAAQIATRSVSEILQQLRHNLVELKSRQRALSPKHRSLRAALQGCFDELNSELLTFVGQLACFWGGFTLLAAKEVTKQPRSEEFLAELVQRSLLNARIDGQQTRYEFLESVRQIAQEQLTPTQLQETVDQHQAYFLGIVAGVDEERLHSLDPVDEEQLNINAAFQRPNPGQPLYWQARIGAIQHACLRGSYATALRHVRESQTEIEEIPSSSLKRDWIASALEIVTEVGLYEEAEQLSTVLHQIGVDSDDLSAEFMYRTRLGLIRSRQGLPEEGIQLHESSLALARSINKKNYISSAVAHLSGSLHAYARTLEPNDPVRISMLLRAKELARDLSETANPTSRWYPLSFLLLAVAEYYLGDFSPAQVNFRIGYESAIALQRRIVQAYCTFFLSQIATKEGDECLAEAYWQEYSDLKLQTGLVRNESVWNRASN